MPETRAVIRAFDRIGDDTDARQTLLHLMLHVDKYVNVVSARSMGGRVAGAPSNTFAAGLVNLVRQRSQWIRDPTNWSFVSTRRHEQFRHLTRHLLARYAVPEFMDHAWFEADESNARRWQKWWIHVARGGNIRTADTPLQLTRRMAHVFPMCPEQTILRNLRWSQVIGMGGSERLARAVVRTRLGRRFENEEFWSTVVLFLANNPMLDPNWAGPVVDYVYNMKFARQRVLREGGGVEDAPPPHPEFTMRRRSATKLLRQVEQWHGTLARESYVEKSIWSPCEVIRGWEIELPVEGLGPVRWVVQELLGSWELAAEGRAMRHCVVSYTPQCVEGHTSIWSIQARTETEPPQGVLTVAIDNQERAITQARGRYNAVPQSRNWSKKQQNTGKGYLQLLDASSQVLRQWQERECLGRLN